MKKTWQMMYFIALSTLYKVWVFLLLAIMEKMGLDLLSYYIQCIQTNCSDTVWQAVQHCNLWRGEISKVFCPGLSTRNGVPSRTWWSYWVSGANSKVSGGYFQDKVLEGRVFHGERDLHRDPLSLLFNS